MSQTKLDQDIKDIKAEIDHVQVAGDPDVLVSHYASLTRAEAIRKFPRRFIVGLLVSIAAM